LTQEERGGALVPDWYPYELPSEDPGLDLGWTDREIERLRPYFDPRTNQPVYIKDIAVARIIQRCYGKRPIYIAVTVPDLMGLEERLVMQGLVFELGDPLPGQTDRTDADLVLENLRRFEWRGLLTEDWKHDYSLYKDENTRRLVQNYSAAFLRVAEARLEEGDHRTAEWASFTGAEVAPWSEPLQYPPGIFLMRMEMHAEAEEHFARMANRGFGTSRLYRMLGRTQELQGRMDHAEESYRRSLDLAPDDYRSSEAFEALRELFSFMWDVKEDLPGAYALLLDWNRRFPQDERIRLALEEFGESLYARPEEETHRQEPVAPSGPDDGNVDAEEPAPGAGADATEHEEGQNP